MNCWQKDTQCWNKKWNVKDGIKYSIDMYSQRSSFPHRPVGSHSQSNTLKLTIRYLPSFSKIPHSEWSHHINTDWRSSCLQWWPCIVHDSNLQIRRSGRGVCQADGHEIKLSRIFCLMSKALSAYCSHLSSISAVGEHKVDLFPCVKTHCCAAESRQKQKEVDKLRQQATQRYCI